MTRTSRSRTRRTRTHRMAVATLAAATALALGACSGEDDEPTTTRTTAGTGDDLAPMEVPATSGAPATTEAPDAGEGDQQNEGAGEQLRAADLPAGTGLVLATELDTNAPVDPSALGGRVTPSQVQVMRRTWNERQLGLDAVQGKGPDASYCESPADGVWYSVQPVSGADPVLLLGTAMDGSTPTCTLEDALVVVDSASSEVLGDDAVALLL